MTMLDNALKYAQRGWCVMPMKTGTKGGFILKDWGNTASDDENQVRDWWGEYPNRNIAIVTGERSGFWVLDIDVKDGAPGLESMAELVKQYGELPKTLVARTATGGWHYFFKMPNFNFRNTTAFRPGLDSRANGGCVIAAPSRLYNGTSYQWQNWGQEIVEAPDWLIDIIAKGDTTAKVAKGAKRVEGPKYNLSQGSRNVSLFKYASSLRGCGLNSDQVYTLLLEENTKCKPEPLDIAEVKSIAYSAGKRYEPNYKSTDEGLEPFSANGRSPGQIAMEMLFSDGTFISVNHELFEYIDGCYQKLDEGAILKKISDLFDRCMTGKNEQHGFARTQHVKEALNHVKSKFYVAHELTKPRGFCVKNGIVKPRYLNNDEVKFDLHPHSPDEYFLFQADFEYKPDLDDTEMNRILNAMLDQEAQSALLRNIAAVIDMNTIRSKFTRALRALILKGEGSNGKDSLRTWCKLLLGETCFSNIPVQVFKRADSNREFQINSLAHSRINWCPESQKIIMDNCQMIKQIITGDPIILEQKHKEPFTIEPEIVMIFNANEVPSFESLSEAIKSRYAIIPFPYVFKDNPDPLQSHERQADSRLKYKPEFLKEYVLPAFLNRLLLEFQLLFKSGIDYSFQEQDMEQIRKDNNHIFEFIDDTNLVMCDPVDGLAKSEVYDLYYDWCIKEGYIITSHFGDLVKLNHPNEQYDKVFTSKKQLINKLKRVFPRLQEGRTMKKRTIGLICRGADNTAGF